MCLMWFLSQCPIWSLSPVSNLVFVPMCPIWSLSPMCPLWSFSHVSNLVFVPCVQSGLCPHVSNLVFVPMCPIWSLSPCVQSGLCPMCPIWFFVPCVQSGLCPMCPIWSLSYVSNAVLTWGRQSCRRARFHAGFSLPPALTAPVPFE